MVAEKKKENNQIPNFVEYEIKRIEAGAKGLSSKILKLRREGATVSEKPKESGTLKTSWSVFKEVWQTTGKDFKKLIGYKTGESVLRGLSPYVQSMLFGSLPGVISAGKIGAMKFFGVAGCEMLRNRAEDVCRFKARMAQKVLNDTYGNAALSSVFEDVLHKPRPYFKNNAPAALNGIAGEIATAKNTLLNSSVDCFSRAIIFGISSASLFAVNPGLAAGVLGVTALTAEFGGFMNKIYRGMNSKMKSLGYRVNKENSDSIQNTPLVRDTNRIDKETQAMKSRLNKSSSVVQKVTYAKSKSYLKMRTAITFGMEALIMGTAFFDMIKTGDIGRFALISGASWQMMGSGNMLSELWTDMQSGTHRLIDASKKLITPKELDRTLGNEKLSKEDTKVSVQGVKFAYPIIKDATDMSLAEMEDQTRETNRTEMVLDNLSVEFDKGELVSVIGTSGNGKSTLMSLIRHDYDVQEGNIYIGNKEIREISDEELNAQIAFVDQTVHFFDDSVRYNLKYFKPDATDEELKEACQKACFDMDVDKFKEGFQYRIGQDGSQLSGGQRQRLALARIFLMDKPIVILDEPTTGLDPKLSLRVMQTLKELAKEKTVIMVTHNPTEVALADRVVVVEKGKIIADGKPMDLVKAGKISQEVLDVQDIKSKRKQYHISVNGENPMKEVAELVGAEDKGYVLSDAERMKKLRLLEAHKRAFVGVRKNALKSERIKEGKPLPQEKEINAMISVSKRRGKEYA